MTRDFDRLSQLQQTLNQQSEIFFTAVGALQRDAPLLETTPEIPVTCWSKEQIEANWTGNKELARTAAKDIVQLSKVIDFLIENLPGIEQTEEEQVGHYFIQMKDLEELERLNQEAQFELEAAVKKGQEILNDLRANLSSKISSFENLLKS